MALPKLSGSGLARSAAGAIGKSVKNGVKALRAMALSQMEPEVLTGIATAKMLKGKLKGKGAGGNSEADVAELKQSIEEIAPEINQTGIQSLTQQVEQVPPRTSEPIVQKIEELKEAKEAETNLEPVVEKLDELTPMLEKIDILTEQNEKDLFSVNLVLDSVDQGITSIESMFRNLLGQMKDDKLNKLENDREASRSKRTQSPFSGRDRTKQSKSGGFLGGIMDMFKGSGILSGLTTILGGGAAGGLLGALGGILGLVMPILLPLILTAATAAAIYAFLQSEMADDISTWLSTVIFDGEEAMKKLNAESAKFIQTLTDGAARVNAAEEDVPDVQKPLVAAERDALDQISQGNGPNQADLEFDPNNLEIGRVNEAMQGSDETLRVEIVRVENQVVNKQMEVDRLSKQKDPGFLAELGRFGVGLLQVMDLNTWLGRDSYIKGGAFNNDSYENLGITDAIQTNAPEQLDAAQHSLDLAERNLEYMRREAIRRKSGESPDLTPNSSGPGANAGPVTNIITTSGDTNQVTIRDESRDPSGWQGSFVNLGFA